jgi:AcrR family transcriptional regulator
MGIETGLRERKKQRTREAIVAAAMRLFDQHGFDGTTIADIAAEADIAPRTFFGYFPSKEDVAFGDVDADFEDLSVRLTNRAPGETAIGALRAWIIERVGHRDHDAALKACRRRLIAESDALAAHDEHIKSRFRDLLGDSVAHDLGDAPTALRPRMVAAAAMAALEVLAPKDEDGQIAVERSPDEALAVLDQATTFLDGGLSALRSAEPGTGAIAR